MQLKTFIKEKWRAWRPGGDRWSSLRRRSFREVLGFRTECLRKVALTSWVGLMGGSMSGNVLAGPEVTWKRRVNPRWDGKLGVEGG